jgi:sugar-specific transcriptional regulator TrmB
MSATSRLPGGGAGDPPGRLEIVGLGALEERLYLGLLATPQATLSKLAADAGVSPTRARRALAVLERLGMLGRQPGSPLRVVPVPPDVAVGALISRRHQDLEQARRYAERLLTDFHQGTRSEQATQLVEIITRPEAIGRRVVQLIRGAQEEVLMFDKPPYLGSLDNPDEFDALARGVRWRTVYSPESLDVPGQLARLRRFSRAGEQSRVSAGIPIKLTIADRRLALLPLGLDQSTADQTAILVRSSSLLATLTMLFETLWARGLSLNLSVTARHATSPPGDEPDRKVLPLLAAGMKDEAIARQLEVSLRTVRRWIGNLMTEYGVTTRFQLGLAVADQVKPPDTDQ